MFSAALARGASATVLLPTMVYGAGRDKTLTQIAGLAQRTGAFVLPANATGLRQPDAWTIWPAPPWQWSGRRPPGNAGMRWSAAKCWRTHRW
ncbi:hypothetical protein M0D45_13320 [Xanthomonas prunicola]|nr:hypothetical protein M0D45_13320 [Xanthomonas prunicola]